MNEKIFDLGNGASQRNYGNRIVMFAPLYLSNYCVNECRYCPYHHHNTHIRAQAAFQGGYRTRGGRAPGHGAQAPCAGNGRGPGQLPDRYVLESIKTIYSIKQKTARSAASTSTSPRDHRRKLQKAQRGWHRHLHPVQETYHKATYEGAAPQRAQSNYAYHTEAMDRAMDGGIDDVGCGVLFGLNLYKYDFVGLLMHAEHLEAVKGVGPHTISVPRIRNADDIDMG